MHVSPILSSSPWLPPGADLIHRSIRSESKYIVGSAEKMSIPPNEPLPIRPKKFQVRPTSSRWRKRSETGNSLRMASGKDCRSRGNNSLPPSRSSPSLLAKPVFLDTSGRPVWHLKSKVYPRQATHPFSSPESGGRGPPKTGIGARSQDQSTQNFFVRADWCFCRSGANTL